MCPPLALPTMSCDLQYAQEFRTWAEHNMKQGINGLGNDAQYIPTRDLLEYWHPVGGPDRISRILRALSSTPVHVPARDVANRYIRIFSTLVYITSSIPNSRVSLIIRDFMRLETDDHLLPFNVEPEPFSHPHSGGPHAWQEFEEAQYLFCPVSLLPNRMLGKELQERRVLPITFDERLSGEPGVTDVVKKYTLHHLDSSTPVSPNMSSYFPPIGR